MGYDGVAVFDGAGKRARAGMRERESDEKDAYSSARAGWPKGETR